MSPTQVETLLRRHSQIKAEAKGMYAQLLELAVERGMPQQQAVSGRPDHFLWGWLNGSNLVCSK